MSTATASKATIKTWFGLAVLVLPLLLIAIDGTILVLALPAISAELNPTGSQQLWILDIYSFMLAGLLVTMASVGDRFGRKRLLLIGAVAFTAASVLGALATTPEMLIGARAALGIAGATIMPSTLSLIRNMFLDRAQRRFAMAVWGAMVSAGAAGGPLVGAWIIETFSWHAAFLINIPVMLVLLVAAPFLLPESRNPKLAKIDFVSAALSLVAMLPIVFAIKSLAEGKDIALACVAGVVGIAAFVLFVRRQLRADEPMINVRLFQGRAFRGAVVTDLLAVFALVGSLFALTQYLQLVLGLGPLQSALWLLPQAALAATSSFVAAALVKRIPAAVLVAGGVTVAGIGFGMLVLLTTSSHPLIVAIALCLVSLGAGTGMTLTNDIIMSSVPPERAGQAAATSETAYELGTALGTAVLGSVVLASYRGAVTVQVEGLGLSARVIEPLRATVSEGLAAASALPGDLAAVVSNAVRVAFTEALATTGVVGLVIMLATAVWAFVTLRGVSADRDLSLDHDH